MPFPKVIFRDEYTDKIPQVFFTSGIRLPKKLLNVYKKKGGGGKEARMTYHISCGASGGLDYYIKSNVKLICLSREEGQKHLFLHKEGCISLKTSSKKKLFSFKKNQGAVLLFLKMGHQMLLF